MNRQIEIRWTIFLFGILLTAFGLLSGFRFNESLEIQMHDTYYIIYNTHLLILIGLILTIAYFLAFGLKRLSTLNSALKMASIFLAGLIGLGFTGLFALMIVTFAMTPQLIKSISTYGILLLLLGLGILFMFRTIEILKMK